MSVGVSAGSVAGEQITARKAGWWKDRGLVGLLVIFAVLAPLITQRIYASDEIKYFAYTHSLFFDRDLDFSNDYLHWYEVDPVKFRAIRDDLHNTREPLTGLPTNEAPIGTGLLWLPSYALAHGGVLLARALGANVAADGWSQPYIAAVCFTSYIFACLGLLLCWSIAKRYFGSRLAAVATVVAWLGTPLIFYTVIAPPWSHATSLMTVTLFIWYWLRTRRQEGRSRREWAVLGLLGGLMMLVREQDFLFLVLPGIEALVAVFDWWRSRSRVWLSRAAQWVVGLIVMGAGVFVAFIPQLLAYFAITGRFGPSRVVSSKFNLTSPNALNVLFNPEHGLFVWHPIILVAILGMVVFWRRDRLLTTALMVAFAMQVYIAGSFLTWQSASSFGQRRFINSTLIFILGIGTLIAWAIDHGVAKWAIGAVAAAFVAWNAGLLMQYALWCSPQRQGLDWNVVLRGQLELPLKVPRLIWDFLTNREVFYQSIPKC
ncbi:MAG TPA: glycosyltransferase family 39 protein [Chloroflexia bacterium]|nr:glycosyltransferase family 39 protein [Chloroflexia bacterium]